MLSTFYWSLNNGFLSFHNQHFKLINISRSHNNNSFSISHTNLIPNICQWISFSTLLFLQMKLNKFSRYNSVSFFVSWGWNQVTTKKIQNLQEEKISFDWVSIFFLLPSPFGSLKSFFLYLLLFFLCFVGVAKVVKKGIFNEFEGFFLSFPLLVSLKAQVIILFCINIYKNVCR